MSPSSSDLPGRVLALDWGERRIGMAISDALRIGATPLGVIHRQEESADLARLAAVAREERAALVVVGLPRNVDDSSGPMVRKVEAFAEALASLLDVPVRLVDETYSSLEADEILRSRIRDPRKRKARRDETAAAVILRGFLDHEAAARRRPAPDPDAADPL